MKKLAILTILLGLLPIGLFFFGPIPTVANGSKHDFTFVVVSKEGIFTGVILVIGGVLLFLRSRLKIDAQKGRE